MHVLIVTSWFIDKNGKNPSIFIEDQVDLLVRCGYRVTVLHPEFAGTFITTHFEKNSVSVLQENGAQIIRLRLKPRVPYLRTTNYRYMSKLIQRAIRELNIDLKSFDLIHSHVFFPAGIVASDLSKSSSKPWIHQEHFSGFVDGSRRISRSEMSLFRKRILSANSFLSVSAFFEQTIKSLVPELRESRVFPIPIHPIFNYKSPRETDTFRFLWIGQPCDLKGGTLLFETWNIFASENPYSELTILGSAKIEAYEQILNSDARKRITWIEWKSRDETAQIIHDHHVLLSTSKFETFGMALAESIACGRPVISTKSGGVSDFIHSKNGVLTNSTVTEFASAMRFIQQNYKYYDLEMISSEILEKYGFQTVSEKITEFYKQFCNSEIA